MKFIIITFLIISTNLYSQKNVDLTSVEQFTGSSTFMGKTIEIIKGRGGGIVCEEPLKLSFDESFIENDTLFIKGYVRDLYAEDSFQGELIIGNLEEDENNYYIKDFVVIKSERDGYFNTKIKLEKNKVLVGECLGMFPAIYFINKLL